MGLNSTSEVARIIGNMSKETNEIKESYADSGDDSFLLSPFEQILAGGSVTVTKKVYDPDSLIWNHLVYGDLNTQSWNGGYLGAGLQMPISFPITFDADSSEVIHSATF